MAGRDDAFRGWPAEALQFYEGLQADKSKTYWAAHQQVCGVRAAPRMVVSPAQVRRVRPHWLL
jgi:hypothetical protein